MKKLISLVLALMLVLAVAVPAMAIEDKPADLTDHEFKAYQIFSGTQSSDSDNLGDIVWGDGINDAAFLAALKSDAKKDVFKVTVKDEKDQDVTIYPFADCKTAKDVAEALSNWTATSDAILEFSKIAFDNKKGNGKEVVSKKTELDPGYYLIVDVTLAPKDETTGEELPDFVTNLALLQVTDSNKQVEINNKVDIPEIEKKIVEGDSKVDVNNASIGDTVSYEFTGTMPTDIANYGTYYYQFIDTLSKGLSIDEDNANLTVTVNGKDATKYFYVDYGTYSATDGTTIKITIGDLKALVNVLDEDDEPVYGAITSDTTVVVTYDATLNENAVIAGTGTPNTVELKYSRSPSDSGEPSEDEPEEPTAEPTTTHPTGFTPKDEVVTYTTELTILKTKEDGVTPLTGAKFTLSGTGVNEVLVSTVKKFAVAEEGYTGTLYYKLTDGTYTDQDPTKTHMELAAEGATSGWVKVEKDETDATEYEDAQGTKGYYVVYDATKHEGKDIYTLVLSNKEDYKSEGKIYKLVSETFGTVEGGTNYSVEGEVASDGTVTFRGLGAGEYKIEETVVPAGYNKAEDVSFKLSFKVDDDGTVTFESDNENVVVGTDNMLDTTIINMKGATLPETGGIGTTIFYMLGTVLLLGAAVLLITKKRVGNN